MIPKHFLKMMKRTEYAKRKLAEHIAKLAEAKRIEYEIIYKEENT